MAEDGRRKTKDESPEIDEGHLRWSFVLRPSSTLFARYSLVSLCILLGLAIALPALGRAQEQQPNQAGLVIQHGDGRVVTACVSFAEPEISGIDLLERAGVSYIAQSGGGGSAVCKLDGEGCDYPAEDCFCRCKGAECIYWAYQSLRGGKWSYSQIGAASFRVKPGDVQGWAWGAGSLQAGAQPPILTLDQICAAPAAAQPTVILPPPTEPPPPTTAPPTEPPQPSPRPTVQPTHAPAPEPSPSSPAATTAATQPIPPTEPATAAATEMRRPTVAPATALPTATAAPTVSSAPTATFRSAGAAATRTPPSSSGSSTGSYLAFGAIALVLAGGIVAALLRRRAR